MPVACQSCAPECPQAFGAQRLRGLNVTILKTSPSFASQMPPPLIRGDFELLQGLGFLWEKHGFSSGHPKTRNKSHKIALLR